MKRTLIALAALVVMTGAEPAFACRCDTRNASRIIDRVPVAFVGKVVNVETVAVHRWRGDQTTTIEVTTVIKGNPPNPARVFTDTEATACGHDFSDDVGKVVAVAVYIDSEGRLTTNSCTMVMMGWYIDPPSRQPPRNP